MADPTPAVDVAERVVESLVPELAPFHPLIALVSTAVIAHFRATGQFPTQEQILAAIPVDWQKLQDTWSAWKPSGDASM